MIDTNHPLVEAARYTDAQGTEHGLEGFVKQIGLDLTMLMFVSEQRAIRSALMHSRGPQEMKRLSSATDPVEVRMSRAELDLLAVFTSAYLDGIAIGWEARRLAATE